MRRHPRPIIDQERAEWKAKLATGQTLKSIAEEADRSVTSVWRATHFGANKRASFLQRQYLARNPGLRV